MKNENQFLFQNGMSWIISALLIKNNKGTIGEPVKPSRYMVKDENTGIWYFDKGLWFKETYPQSSYTYSVTTNYILLPSRVIYSQLNAPYNDPTSDYYTIIYFIQYTRSWSGSSAQYTNASFSNAVYISFNSYQEALNCLTKGNMDNGIIINSALGTGLSITINTGDMSSGNRLFLNWYNNDNTIRYVNDISPYYSSITIPRANKNNGGWIELPSNPYTGG